MTVAVLWLCNILPQQAAASGSWLTALAEHLEDQALIFVAPGRKEQSDGCCHSFPAHWNDTRLRRYFYRLLAAQKPALVHIHGTEYPHALVMAQVCAAERYPVLVSIQGLATAIAPHYGDGIEKPLPLTLRDLLRRGGIQNRRRWYALATRREQQLLQLCSCALGRTDWDRSQLRQLAPALPYRHCGEVLRPEFYQGQWDYGRCQKHRIFLSGGCQPIKGLHLLLKALPALVARYPDIQVYTTGPAPAKGFWGRQRQTGYTGYIGALLEAPALAGRVHFLGTLTAAEMKAQYLRAHLFVLPSVMENSPNALAEAMVLGTPAVAADVGGVGSMLGPELSEHLYPALETAQLTDRIRRIFDQKDQITAYSQDLRARGLANHDPAAVCSALLALYREGL